MTREQFLQQRKDVAGVSRRQSIIPLLLLVVPFLTVICLFNKEKPPTSAGDLLLFGSLSAVGLIGLLWSYYRMYADAKLHAFHCPSCGKNNGGNKASAWLIATGKCFHCKERIIQHEPEDKTPILSRPDFEDRVKKMRSRSAWTALAVGIPITIALIVMNFQKLYLTDFSANTTSIVLMWLAVAAFIFTVLAVLIWLEWHLNNRSGLRCPKCRSMPRNYRLQVLLATGHCPDCGQGVFENKPPHAHP